MFLTMLAKAEILWGYSSLSAVSVHRAVRLGVPEVVRHGRSQLDSLIASDRIEHFADTKSISNKSHAMPTPVSMAAPVATVRERSDS